MSDVLVILGTITIVGIVAIATVALVYDRFLWFRGTKTSVELQTKRTGEAVEPMQSESLPAGDR
jgi:hypothetical protein